MKKILSVGLMLVLVNLVVAQSAIKDSCSILRNGTFKYLDAEDTTAYFVISPGSHVEYLRNSAYTIKSKVTWLNDCSYKMLMLSNTLPEFPFKPGQTMTVIIDKVENGIIYYTSKVQGEKWQGRLVKVK